MHLFALECIVACCFEKRDKTRQKRDKQRGKQKIPNKKRGEALPKKTSPPKRLRQNSPSRQIILRGGISQREKINNQKQQTPSENKSPKDPKRKFHNNDRSIESRQKRNAKRQNNKKSKVT